VSKLVDGKSSYEKAKKAHAKVSLFFSGKFIQKKEEVRQS
jgi:hypothetical protein